MNIAFLSVGGNLGNRLEHLRAAERAIAAQCGRVTALSGIYETEPWGSSSGRHYLNRVIRISTALSAQQLLRSTLAIEAALGRKRGRDQNADRTIDIDVLFFNRELIDKKTLQVPHPRLHLRKFVLIPFCDIDRNFVHPVLNKTMGALLKQCPDPLKAVKYKEPASPRYICIEGNIGSGKSTLAKALSKKLNAAYLPEQFEENPLLPLFYESPETYAFSLEYGFMLERFRQLSLAFGKDPARVVSDFSFYKSLWFGEMTLPENEFKLLKRQAQTLASLLPAPELLIYLDTSVNNLKQNIAKRGRPYEQRIKKAYLERLEKQYKRVLPRLKNTRLLVIPVKKYHAGLERDLIKIIETNIKENFG